MEILSSGSFIAKTDKYVLAFSYCYAENKCDTEYTSQISIICHYAWLRIALIFEISYANP